MDSYIVAMAHIILSYVALTNTYMILDNWYKGPIRDQIRSEIWSLMYDFHDTLKDDLKKALKESEMEGKNTTILNALRILDEIKKQNEKNS